MTSSKKSAFDAFFPLSLLFRDGRWCVRWWGLDPANYGGFSVERGKSDANGDQVLQRVYYESVFIYIKMMIMIVFVDIYRMTKGICSFFLFRVLGGGIDERGKYRVFLYSFSSRCVRV